MNARDVEGDTLKAKTRRPHPLKHRTTWQPMTQHRPPLSQIGHQKDKQAQYPAEAYAGIFPRNSCHRPFINRL